MKKRKIDAMHAEYGLSTAGRCYECCNFVKGKYHGRTLSKCIAYGLTHSEATDWAGKHLACGLFGKPFDELSPKRRPLIEVSQRTRSECDLEPLDGQMSL